MHLSKLFKCILCSFVKQTLQVDFTNSGLQGQYGLVMIRRDYEIVLISIVFLVSDGSTICSKSKRSHSDIHFQIINYLKETYSEPI